jgi:hypothetical protein
MYSSLEAWQADVELMCDNAMAYNVEGSTVYNDAAFLKVGLGLEGVFEGLGV